MRTTGTHILALILHCNTTDSGLGPYKQSCTNCYQSVRRVYERIEHKLLHNFAVNMNDNCQLLVLYAGISLILLSNYSNKKIKNTSFPPWVYLCYVELFAINKLAYKCFLIQSLLLAIKTKNFIFLLFSIVNFFLFREKILRPPANYWCCHLFVGSCFF